MQREEQARSPTKSERDSAVFGRVGAAIPPVVARIFWGDSTSPLTRGGKNVVRSEGEASNPSVLTAKRFGDKKGVDMQLKRNKATVCALPSIHLPLTREARVMVQSKG